MYVYLPVSLSALLSVCLSVFLSGCLCVCVSVCLCVCLSVCLSVSVRLSWLCLGCVLGESVVCVDCVWVVYWLCTCCVLVMSWLCLGRVHQNQFWAQKELELGSRWANSKSYKTDKRKHESATFQYLLIGNPNSCFGDEQSIENRQISVESFNNLFPFRKPLVLLRIP